ncbi:MAG: threo-3-hydroxy-L-aspartate ammonia-lyase [Burkholderiales bacterium]|nr:threo-3-hydroxy-L-aspartate ammonia-lyase [Burkholderiales bacterium]
MPTPFSPPTFQDVIDAAGRLRGHAHRTPVLRSATADAMTGAQLFFKCENFQRMGAFKFRGAFNALSRFSAVQRKAGVIAFSSGNHAQAVALSARMLGIPAVILMPQDAPQAKVDATRGYLGADGGEIILFDRYTQDREALTRELADQRGLTIVPPFNHADVIAGQGTAARELLEDAGALDYLFVCVGGGGLISGSALAARALAPACKVIGVEPEAGNDAQRSLRTGTIVTIPTPQTIADGAQTQSIGTLTFEIIRRDVNDIVTVTDAQLVAAMRFFAERMKIVVEPTGCLGFAGALQAGKALAGARVGIVISGGNVDMARFAALLAG